MTEAEAAIRVAEDGPRCTVHVTGALDLSNALLLHEALLKRAPGPHGEKQRSLVDISGVTRADLSGLQLLCSAHRTYVVRGGDLSLEGQPEWFGSLCAAAGFERRRSTCPYRRADACLWKA